MPIFKVSVTYHGDFTIEAESAYEAEQKAKDLDLEDAELWDVVIGDAELSEEKPRKKEKKTK